VLEQGSVGWGSSGMGVCNGYTVTGSRHSRYTESNIYSSCTRVELGCLYMLVTCSIGCTSHQSLILYIVAINIYNITRLNRGMGDPLHSGSRSTVGTLFTDSGRSMFLVLISLDTFTLRYLSSLNVAWEDMTNELSLFMKR